MSTTWDLVVVGAGPAGAAAALGALHRDPTLRVLLLDRSDFPRDKSCGDGVAPHVLDVLSSVGAGDLLDGLPPLRRLRISLGDRVAERPLARPVWVVPRTVLDARLVERAVAAGAHLRRHRVRHLGREPDGSIVLDDRVRGAVVVGADGAYSVLRRTVARTGSAAETGRRRAVAIRGYAPTSAEHVGLQVIRYGDRVQPSYAWSFDRGDGLANVGYGELVGADAPPPSCQRVRSPWRHDALTSRRRVTRQGLLDELERLLPGTTADGVDWRAHQLPLSGWPRRRAAPAAGRVLLAGDAAHLVNPMTGEGIFYAVATGVLAGRAAADALAADDPASAGDSYARAVRRLLARHQRHTTVAARLSGVPRVVGAGIDAAARSQDVFDDLVEIGLGRGTITPGLAAGLARALAVPAPPPHPTDREELPWRS